MSVRRNRQEQIIDLIQSESISTQDELIRKLEERGFEVTQATVSRDIKDLKLVKRVGKSGRSEYGIQETDSDHLKNKYYTILKGSVMSADYAGNTCVIKTHVGMANAACASIDAMHWDGIVGTLAGDDTIFVLCRDNEKTAVFCEKLLKLVKE